MSPDDFEATTIADCFCQSIQTVINWFKPKMSDHGLQPSAAASLICKQIFHPAPQFGDDTPLFRLFCTNSQNRSGGVPLTAENWNDLGRHIFRNWQYAQVVAQSVDDLCDAVLTADATYHLIRGDRDGRHRPALEKRITTNSWVRLLKTAHHGAALFANLEKQAYQCDRQKLDALCKVGHVDLRALALPSLTATDLWLATAQLRDLFGIGWPLALNFLKDAGIDNAFKPDVHTCDLAGRAFRGKPSAYSTDLNGLKACVSAALAFTQQLARSYPSTGKFADEFPSKHQNYEITLASVDRLMWTAGAGRIWIDDHDIRLPRRQSQARRQVVAGILRAAVKTPDLFVGGRGYPE
jgi:hypothetical protein